MTVFYIAPQAQVDAGVITEAQVPAYMEWVNTQLAQPVALGEPISGWQSVLQQVVYTVGSFVAPEFTAALKAAIPPGGIEPGEFVEQFVQPKELATMAIGDLWDEWGFEDVSFQDLQQGLSTAQQFLPQLFNGSSGGSVVPAGGGGGGGEGGVGALVAGAGIWLGSALARMGLSGARAAVFVAANGVKARMSQLWPYVRQYGPQAVAAALGIGVAELGTLLMQPAAMQYRYGAKKRRRGISARDVKTTRRTIGQLRSLSRMAGIGGGGRSRSYRPRARRRYNYYC